ncbi:AN1-type zinc finger protein 6-like [Solea solea]|uniref:AN1-type zinc finger protein 6-like n=1 Tax=Solea solea TaxID=90069 RepID=UPI00272D7F8F|nr:AN1-type zinc finger protein 6-like [Solea solea]
MSGKQDMTQETNRRSPVLCSTGCGFYGNPRNNGMCSVCYKDFLQRQSGSACATTSAASSAHSSSSRGETLLAQSCDSTTISLPAATSSVPEDSGHCSGPSTATARSSSLTADCLKTLGDEGSVDRTAETQKPKEEKKRCFTCRKKVGLTGFDCRCGHIFCSLHRYSDEHNCTFDYRAEGAERIRRENPKVTGEKIRKL